MPEINLNIDDLLSNENAKITLLLGPKEFVTGFITDNPVFSGGNQYDSPFESEAQRSLSSKINAISQAANAAFGTEFSQIQLKHIGQTLKTWVSSEAFRMTVPFVFIAIREEDDVLAPVKKLHKAVMPSIGDGAAGKFTIKAPLNYQIKGPDSASGTVTLAIGQWLKIPNLLISSVSHSVSQVTLKSGLPVYAQGQVELESFRMITAEDFEGFFSL